jgi:hypothetical protein
MKRVTRVSPRFFAVCSAARRAALHVEPLSHRLALDVRQVGRIRQVGQALARQDLKCSLLAPQAHQPRQALARRALGLLGARQVERRIGIKALFAQPACKLVEVAHLLHAPGQFGAGLGGLLHLAHVAHRLFGRHGLHPGLARVGGQAQHAHRDRPWVCWKRRSSIG